MITYTVHEPPDPPADRIDRAERLKFVRDGFHWGAFLLTPLWLLGKRLWLPLLGFVAFALLLAGAFEAQAIDARWATFLVVAVQAIAGFEAGSLVRWGLERRGWRTTGSVTGRNRSDCERRFFAAWLPGQPAIAMAKAGSAPRRGWWLAPVARLIGRKA